MIMTSKIYSDSEFGTIVLRKNARSRAISIRVRGNEGREGGRISVTVPWSLRYQDGISYLEKRREWVREALSRQDKRSSDGTADGHSIGIIGDGTVIRTLLSEIVVKRSVAVDSGANMLPNRRPNALPRLAATDEKIRIKVRRSVVENPAESGRLWLSVEKPLYIKVIEFPGSSTDIGKAPQTAGNEAVNGHLTSVGISQALKKVLVEMLREEAKMLLPQKAALFAEQYGFRFRNITIKHNSSNWGSCSRAGNINLNLNLMRLPEPLCDYVILHELCHLKEPNHGPRFHALLEALCLCNIRHLLSLGSPDAEKYRPWLDAATAVKSSLTDTFKSTAYKAGMLERPQATSRRLPPLDEVLSREISRWRLA